MFKRYHFTLAFAFLLFVGLAPAMAQTSFEAVETCNEGASELCNAVTTAFPFQSGSMLFTDTGGTADLVANAACPVGAQCVLLGSTGDLDVTFTAALGGVASDLFFAFESLGGSTGSFTATFQGGDPCTGNSGPDGTTFLLVAGAAPCATSTGQITAISFDVVSANGGILDDIRPNSGLAVEMDVFTASVKGTNVMLNWQTRTEENNAGFEIEMLSNGAFVNVGYVDGFGTTVEAQNYTYEVTSLAPGKHIFRLRQLDFDGSFTYSQTIEAQIELPGTHHLSPAYPNPFNPATQFTLTVAQAQDVNVAIFDMLGRQVATLHSGLLAANEAHTFRFEATALPSGIYLVRAAGADFATTRQVTLLK